MTISIQLGCELCDETASITPAAGPYADMEIWITEECMGVETVALDLPEGWQVFPDGRCLCPEHRSES